MNVKKSHFLMYQDIVKPKFDFQVKEKYYHSMNQISQQLINPPSLRSEPDGACNTFSCFA